MLTISSGAFRFVEDDVMNTRHTLPWLSMALGMEVNSWEWDGMGIITLFPHTSRFVSLMVCSPDRFLWQLICLIVF